MIALHGFAGLASDWAAVSEFVPMLESANYALRSIDLWPQVPGEREGENGLWEWAKAWTHSLALKQSEIRADRSANGKEVLLGYSMGGRLALHALLAKPSLFSAAILVSVNPGLATADERVARQAADAIWAKKWHTQNWQSVWREWNAQGVFAKGAQVFEREESQFDRSALARAMRVWSLGQQEDLRTAALGLKLPILWIVGEQDQKFLHLQNSLEADAREMEVAGRNHQFAVIAGAGHRVPWDQPRAFTACVQKFLSGVEG